MCYVYLENDLYNYNLIGKYSENLTGMSGSNIRAHSSGVIFVHIVIISCNFVG